MPRKQPSIVDLFGALRDWAKLVSDGADPIEALHGHKCGPTCWHTWMAPKPAKCSRCGRGEPDPAKERDSMLSWETINGKDVCCACLKKHKLGRFKRS
mgnify:CR=1 FL=1